MQPTLDVTAILAELGITVTRVVGTELYALCPGHEARTGKPDTRASWSINEVSYVHHCFSCGYSGGLQTLYMDQTGEVPEDLVWQITKASVQNSAFGALDPEDLPEVVPDPEDEPIDVSEWALSQYMEVPDRLLDLRHLSRHAVNVYGVRWDKENRRWVIPIRWPNGDLLGYQFRQKGIELNLPKGIEKSECLFGFWEFVTLGATKIAIVESPLDAVRMWSAGIPCVSSYGAYVSDTQLTLLGRNFKTVICAMDNDAPGKRANDFIRSRLSGYSITWEMQWPLAVVEGGERKKVKDPGDIADNAMLKSYWLLSQGLDLSARPSWDA